MEVYKYTRVCVEKGLMTLHCLSALKGFSSAEVTMTAAHANVTLNARILILNQPAQRFRPQNWT